MNKESEFFKHLEFLGYSVECEDDERDFWVARGGSHPGTLTIRPIEYGLLFLALYPLPSGFECEHVNKLNKTSIVSRFVIADEDIIAQECFYPNNYNKQGFGKFMDGIREDITELKIVVSQIKEPLED